MTDQYQRIAERLAEQGWWVEPGFIDEPLRDELAGELYAAYRSDGFRPAGVGRGDGLAVRPEIRSDQVLWIDPDASTAAQRRYLGRIERLRQAINSTAYLGLFDFEGHLALYPPGSFYRRHLDRFADNSRRTVSTVLYLNDHWLPGDGGALRLYTDPHDDQAFTDVLPTGGTLVTFLSDRFPHEVLPARRDRLSLTGWYRTRG